MLLAVQQSAYLTVPDVASELGMSRAGVYKLIERGKLKAIRRTERGIRVSRLALDAYKRRVQAGRSANWHLADEVVDLDAVRVEFERETGMSPAEWERRWKSDEFADTAANMRRTIRALALRAAQTSSGAGKSAALEPWLAAALRQMS